MLKIRILGVKYWIIAVSFITTPIWYFPFIMETMIIFVVVQCVCVKYLKNKKQAFVLLFASIMAIIPSPFHATAEFVLIFLVAMAANYRKVQLMKIYHKIRISGILILSFVLFVIGWIAFKRYESLEHQFCLSWWYSFIQDGDWFTFPLRQVAILMFVPVFAMITYFCSGKYNRFSRYGSLTLSLYPLNCIFVVVFKEVFDAYNRYAQDVSLWWLVLAYMLAVLFSSIGLVEILSKNSFTRFCFLGH